MLDYRNMADADSMYNTPPCWAVYVCGLVFRRLLREGGVAAAAAQVRSLAASPTQHLPRPRTVTSHPAASNLDTRAPQAARKAALLYDAIDASCGFYASAVERSQRSWMNIPFGIPRSAALEAAFVREAAAAGMVRATPFLERERAAVRGC